MSSNPTKTDVYMDEYVREDIIARYISKSAGAGIAHVLTEVYQPIYLRVIADLMAIRGKDHEFRVLEYGCGGGMNLLKIMGLLNSRGARLEHAYGADFSPPMIEAARKEAGENLSPELMAKLTYAVAGNEDLLGGLSRSLTIPEQQLRGSFDLIVGVNTTRYAHRLNKEAECARDIFALLAPGGYTVMIDMNRHFPFFRSKVKRMFEKNTMETYIPSLATYTKPFRDSGFDIKESRNFCWIPHSANQGLLSFCRTMTPVLDACFSPFAMRSLVVGQKPR